MRLPIRRILLCIALISTVTVAAFGQDSSSGGVAGIVLDAETREPLAGVTVVLSQDGTVLRGATTDANGRFAFDDLPPEATELEVRFLGYEPRTEELRLAANRDSEITIALAPAPITLSAIEIIGESAEVYRRLPGTATKISPREVEMISPIGTQELLSYVPGVVGFADDGIGNSRISIGIRGLNPRRSSRVLILEDGIPIQPALYVYPNMYYNPPVERIDRVEVIKGAAAVKYGPQTMGGVINYITSRPRSSFGGSGRITTGTNGFVSLFGEVGGFGNDTFKPEVQLLFKRGDGFRENNAFTQYNGTFKLSVTPDPERTIYAKFNTNYENSNATYTGLTEYSFATDPAFNPKDDDVFKVFRTSLDLIYHRRYNQHLNGTTRGYVSYFDRRWWREDDVFVRAGDFDAADPVPDNPVPWYTGGNLLRVGGGRSNFGILRTFYVAGVEQSYAYEHTLFGRRAGLEVGARLHFERFIDDKKIGSAPDARDGVYFVGNPDDPESIQVVGQSHHYETTALALYAAEQVELGALSVVPGIRFEVFEQERINRLQGASYLDKTSYVILPGLGLNYELGRLNVFGGIHRGYTPPSSGTLKIVHFGESTEDSGLDLRAEKSWNSEFGVRGQLPWLAFEATGFHLYIEDMVAAGRGTAFKNLGRVQTYGVELAGTIGTSGLLPYFPDVNLSYTFLQTEILKGRIESAQRAGVEVDIAGNALPYAPTHTLVIGLARHFDAGLDFRADLRFVDRVFTDFENIEETSNRGDTGPVPAHTVVDASMRYRLNDRLDVQLTVKNLFDEVYIGSRLHSNPGQPEAHLSSGILPGPRRQVNLGLRYRL